MRRTIFKAAIIGAAVTVLGAACGGGADSGGSAEADRVVEVAQTDNAFSPDAITATVGETVTFKFTNNGAVAHDAFIGDAKAQEEHGKDRAKSGEDSMGGGEDSMGGGEALMLEPGKSGELTYTFDEAGEILIGCHEPGHYEGGMKATVTVT